MQKILLFISYCLMLPFAGNRNDIEWVVGVDEIAAYVHNIANMLDNAVSVSFSKNIFYSYKYSYALSVNKEIIQKILRIFYGPVLLGYLLHKARGFFYVGSTGFLLDSIDGREYEFSLIKKNNKKLLCIFVGSDIRSYKKMMEYAKLNDIDCIFTYYYAYAHKDPFQYENYRKIIAYSADTYADIIYNAPIDQISYLEKDTFPFFYIYPDNAFIRNDDKYKNVETIKIVHAPSNPIIKGTPLVRAAIKKLKSEGYNFNYVELINVPHERILSELRGAHIVLNEFYAFVPGVFGIEALAAHCALLTSADCMIETSLPKDSNAAWMATKYWKIYDNLKYLLDNPSEIKKYADTGFEWAKRNWAYSIVRENLRNTLSLVANTENKIN